MKLDLDEFEKILIYKALTDASYLTSIVDHIQAKFFNDKNIAKVFGVITNFYQLRGVLPSNDELKVYLTTDDQKSSYRTLIQTFRSMSLKFNKDELYENTERFLKERGIYHTLLEIAENVVEGSVDTSDALLKFEKACSVNLITDVGLEITRDITKITELMSKKNKTISSSWDWFDDSLEGGFSEDGRAMYVFVGQPNIGKSIVLGNVAVNIANQGKNVLVVTLEMSEDKYASRIISNLTSIPMYTLPTEPQTIQSSIRKSSQDGRGEIFIKEFPPATITPVALKGYIKKLLDSGVRVDAIVLDYLNLMKGGDGDNSYERIKEISEQLRAMTYEFSCPLITASQLNRGGFDVPNPSMNTISESVGLAATADVIVSLYQSDHDRENQIMRFGMMKNRVGEKGHTQPFKIDYQTLSLRQATEDEVASSEEDLEALSQYCD